MNTMTLQPDTATSALAGDLPPAANAARFSNRQHAGRLQRAGQWLILGAIVPLGAWMAFAPLSMAVVAPAEVKVDLNRRPVQHLEGGIVREVLVRDGQRVAAGEPILRLGDVGVDADRNRVDFRVHTERASLARLDAERRFAAQLAFPADLQEVAQRDPRLAEVLAKERALFRARRGSLDSEVALMRAQREHVDREIVALEAQVAQAQNSLELQRSYVATNQSLLKDGFISATRISQMEATVADYAAKHAAQQSELARAQQRIVDIDLKITSMRNQYMQDASDQLKVTAARLSEIEQEQRKSDDAAARQLVTAPAAGEVIDLKFTSPGAVVRPGEPIAEIVPSDAQLKVEARIRPEEVNHVYRTQQARIKLTAFKYRSAGMVDGTVSYVSADRLVDPATHQPYYTVTIEADAASLSAVGDLKLQAGMPAEVYLEGSQQTALQYLMEPITSTVRKAGRSM